MTAKEFLQDKYVFMRGHWNETAIDDNWVAEMMEAYHNYKMIRQYPVTSGSCSCFQSDSNTSR